MKDVFDIIFSVPFAFAVLRVTTPILFAALGAVISDKAGVINIGLEGIMLFAAFMGVLGSWFTSSALIGLLFALISAVILAFGMAYFVLTLKTHVILAGIALNIFSSGATVFLLYLFANNKGVSSLLKSSVMPEISIPILSHIPIVGDIISGHNVLTYVALLSVIGVYILLHKTVLGLRIRSVGENANAAQSVGINVIKTQYIALMISGLLAGFGGAYMSMGYVSWFSANMTAGRGFIALAAAAMGGNTSMGTFIASLFFGFTDALSNSVQSLRIPSEFIRMMPYLATIIGIVVYSMRKKNNKKIKR